MEFDWSIIIEHQQEVGSTMNSWDFDGFRLVKGIW